MGPGPVAGSRPGPGVRAVVRHATLALHAVRATESLLWAATGLALTFCALIVSGAELSADAWIVASVAALATGASWWCAHRPKAQRVADQLDREMEFDGALVTAFEAESAQPTAGGVAHCLVERVRQRLTIRAARRAIAPSSAPSIAAPFLALALFSALAEDAAERSASELPELVGGLSSVLGSALQRARLAPEDGAEESSLAELSAQARRLEAKLGRGQEAEAEAALAELDELDGELSDLRREVIDGPLASELDEARAWLDAARTVAREAQGQQPDAVGAGEPQPARPSQATAPGELLAERAGTQDAGAGPGAATGNEAVQGGALTPQQAAGDGGESQRAPDSANVPPEEVGPEGGRVTGGAWAARYDRLVEGWSQRARQLDRAGL